MDFFTIVWTPWTPWMPPWVPWTPSDALGRPRMPWDALDITTNYYSTHLQIYTYYYITILLLIFTPTNKRLS